MYSVYPKFFWDRKRRRTNGSPFGLSVRCAAVCPQEESNLRTKFFHRYMKSNITK
jgi:hypothetical protein